MFREAESKEGRGKSAGGPPRSTLISPGRPPPYNCTITLWIRAVFSLFFRFIYSPSLYFWLLWVFTAVPGPPLAVGSRAPPRSGCRPQWLRLMASRARAQQSGHTGSVAPRRVETSQTRDRAHVPTDRQILTHWATRHVLHQGFNTGIQAWGIPALTLASSRGWQALGHLSMTGGHLFPIQTLLFGLPSLSSQPKRMDRRMWVLNLLETLKYSL